MPTLLLGVVTLLYVGTAVSLVHQKQPALGLAFAAYALANVGLILVARGTP